jgi:hypothetical protein
VTVTATLVLDLTAADADLRCRELSVVRDGGQVVVWVGALFPVPRLVHLIAAHAERLHIGVQGHDAIRVREWYAALRSGDPLADPGHPTTVVT